MKLAEFEFKPFFFHFNFDVTYLKPLQKLSHSSITVSTNQLATLVEIKEQYGCLH